MNYKFSAQPGSNTSHAITTTEALANIPIQEALTLAKQKAKKVFRFDPRRYGAKKIGGGAYGTAYLMQMSPSSLSGLQEGIAYGGGRIVTSMPRMGERVVVKIATQRKQDDVKFYQENIKENIVHKQFSVGLCKSLPTAQKPICISRYVPQFYLSFIDGTSRKHESVTVMGLAGNISLNTFVSHKKIPVDFYVDIERAICSMWLAGYLHGDLHRENIMIDTRTKKIQIIDFGFALKMPTNFVNVLSRRISAMISHGKFQSLADVWTEKPIHGTLRLINYSNRVMKGRGYPWYNPDYKILRSLWNQVPRSMRKQIPAARSALWGISMIPKQNEKRKNQQKIIHQHPATSLKIKMSSPMLRASAAKTYRSSQHFPRTASKMHNKPLFPKNSSSKVSTSFHKIPQFTQKVSTSSHKIPQFTQKVPTSSHKIPQFTQKVPTSSQKVKKYTQKIPQSFTPNPMSSPYKQFSTLHSLTDAERAMIYARRNPQHKSIANLQKRKMECQYRGMMYNPITKQCTLKIRPSFRGCKEDCARIGKRCGPRGTCIKL